MSVTFIPPKLGAEVKSNAERKIFDLLHSLKFSSCCVLHSLGLPKHKNKLYGEADFVLVCPRGILVLEIKGGRVSCSQGKWIYTDRYGNENEKAESPFEQAKGNMFTLMNELNSRLYGTELYKSVLCGFGVMFPDIEFAGKGEECPQELVFGARSEINAYVNGVFDWWESRPQSKKMPLSEERIKMITNILRPDFCYAPLLSSELNETERHLVNLTNEQALVLDGLSENARLLIKGGAGTGKTLLASHYAVQRAKNGEKILFLTFNKNLANTIGRHAKTENLKVINIHAFFGEHVKTSAEEIAKDSHGYFSRKLPKLFCDYIKSLSDGERSALQFDALVMDEAQDFVCMNNLDALDFVLKGGLENGKWAVFYDDEQNIFNKDFEDGFDFLNSYSLAKFTLSKNCRNTIQIGEFCAKKGSVKMNSFLCEEGQPVRVVKYSADNEFEKSVKNILAELRGGKVDLRDVTFLTPHRLKNSKFVSLKISFNELGENYNPDSPLPRYATIQGFKGLDSKIVVVADIESVSKENFAKYFYIACTRARTLLYVLSKTED